MRYLAGGVDSSLSLPAVRMCARVWVPKGKELVRQHGIQHAGVLHNPHSTHVRNNGCVCAHKRRGGLSIHVQWAGSCHLLHARAHVLLLGCCDGGWVGVLCCAAVLVPYMRVPGARPELSG